MEQHEVVIIGGGPAGLSTALALSKAGVKDVVVLERETDAGGVPRHCGHKGFAPYWGFGLMTGPQLSEYLRQQTQELDVRCGTTALEFTIHDALRVHSRHGISEIVAKNFVLATGAREASRAARLIGGQKLAGVMSTGELQQRVYLKGEKPTQNPVIVGSEWVSYSVLLTCRHLKINPAMMIAEDSAFQAPSYFAWGARLLLGARVKTGAKLLRILGARRVEAVEIMDGGAIKQVACDGVILTGKFRSEDALYSGGFIERDGSAPRVSDGFRTSRTNVFAVGNVLGRLETAGQCMVRGRELAKLITA